MDKATTRPHRTIVRCRIVHTGYGDEIAVRAWDKDGRYPEADYFTNDLYDACLTMNVMLGMNADGSQHSHPCG